MLVVGCAWLRPPSEEKNLTVSSAPRSEGKEGIRLSQGTKLLIVPFTAGSAVEATEELDKIALMMVKGIAETVAESGKSVEIVDGEQANKVDFILRGHVTEIEETGGGLSRWWGKPQQKILGVEVALVDYKTNRVVAHFVQQKESAQPNVNYRTLGLELGREIGQSLVSKMN